MKLDITMTTGWIALEPVEIPDDELQQLWQAHQADYLERYQDQGHPDWSEFLHELIYERIEQPAQQRLEAVAGISSIDFQESIIRDGDGRQLA
jgi:hypothetical protein